MGLWGYWKGVVNCQIGFARKIVWGDIYVYAGVEGGGGGRLRRGALTYNRAAITSRVCPEPATVLR